MSNALRFVLLFSVAVWVGGQVFFTFLVTPAIFKALPRDTAGDLVSTLFPKYWALGYAAGFIAVASILLLSFREKSFPRARIALLVFMTGLTMYSGMVIGPRARQVRLELKSAAEPAKIDELKASFRREHMESYAVNMAVMAAGAAFIFLTARNAR
ncbi:MAG: DUF4149 domain-containing protein [Deltaproteobacteria bacterium]|nr:DUF4149 domain-containing protein [Deltaproteobacteria bacterium]